MNKAKCIEKLESVIYGDGVGRARQGRAVLNESQMRGGTTGPDKGLFRAGGRAGTNGPCWPRPLDRERDRG